MKNMPKKQTLPENFQEMGNGAGHNREAELQKQLNEALFIGKFMGAINATLDPNDVCAIAARVLYEHVPYLRIVFSLSEKLGSNTLTFSPAEPKQSGFNPAAADSIYNSDADSIRQIQCDNPTFLCNDNIRFRRYSFELPEEMGNIEVFFDKRAISSLSVLFLTGVAENFARTLKNSLEYSKVKELAMRDSLTGLFNRRVFDEMLGLEGERQKLMPLSLLLIDLDDFKRVNDTFGHSAGDQVLATFGRILRESCRGADLVARYGGEEFAVVLPTTPSSKAFEIAQRLRIRFAATAFAFEGRHFKLTASIGIACTFDTSSVPVSDLVQRADNALYRAKKEGKNRISVYSTGKVEPVGRKTERKKTNARRQAGELAYAGVLTL